MWRSIVPRSGIQALAVILFSVVTSSATTVLPPTFTQLAQSADSVIHGRVLGHHVFQDDVRGHRIVRTQVRVRVMETLAGVDVGRTLDLLFLGGRADGLNMTVSGMPQFVEGEEVVLFVRDNGTSVCPLVHWSYGHYRVSRAAEGGSPRVKRADFTPVAQVGDVERPLFERNAQMQALSDGNKAMGLGEFAEAVRSERGEGGRHE